MWSIIDLERLVSISNVGTFKFIRFVQVYTNKFAIAYFICIILLEIKQCKEILKYRLPPSEYRLPFSENIVIFDFKTIIIYPLSKSLHGQYSISIIDHQDHL